MTAFSYTDSQGISRLISQTTDPHAVLAAEIGTAYAEYRKRWEAARSFRELPGFPIHVDYEMKFRCNLRCPMCLMSLPPEKRACYGSQELELEPQKVVELMRRGAALGQRAAGFGGLWEPLLALDLPEIVAEGRAAGLVDILFNTNGLLLTEKTGEALIRAGLTKLMISLDAATPETYARMRPGSDFATVAANIENFMKLRRSLGRVLPLVRLSFCLTALNEAELPAFLERWGGVVDFFSIQTYGAYESVDPPGFASNHETPAPALCAQPYKRLTVRHNGDVTPCCDASGLGLIMGNIHDQDLADIWRGEGFRSLRKACQNGDFASQAQACLACRAKFQPR